MKQHSIQPDGTVQITDQRTPAQSAAAQLDIFRQRAQAEILAAAPEHTQRNAALGILSVEEKEAIVAAVRYPRTRFHVLKQRLEAMVAAGESCDAIEALTWEQT